MGGIRTEYLSATLPVCASTEQYSYIMAEPLRGDATCSGCRTHRRINFCDVDQKHATVSESVVSHHFHASTIFVASFQMLMPIESVILALGRRSVCSLMYVV